MGNPMSSDRLAQIRARGSFSFKMNHNNHPINVYKTEDDGVIWFILDYQDQMIGYIRLHTVNDAPGILQVKESYIFEPWRNVGIGTQTYLYMVRFLGVGLIHDTQLSPPAEALWKDKFIPNGTVKGIYDKVLNIVHPMADVGKTTSDGSIILSPDQDTSDPVVDHAGDDMRFFWIIESMHGRQPATMMLESWVLYHMHGDALYDMDEDAYHWGNRTPIVWPFGGF